MSSQTKIKATAACIYGMKLKMRPDLLSWELFYGASFDRFYLCYQPFISEKKKLKQQNTRANYKTLCSVVSVEFASRANVLTCWNRRNGNWLFSIIIIISPFADL